MTSMAGVAPARSCGAVAWPAVTTGLALLFTAGLWAFCHPYAGIQGDANVYLGRILADLDPSGVGRDLMFVHDGQSKFSLFPILARPLVAALGAARASMVIAAFAGACWFAALVAMARTLADGRTAWAIVLFVTLLPIGYGFPGVFSFGETLALPRPFAEAAVLAGLAALLTHRHLTAGVLLTLAFLLHPIMAASGIGGAALHLLGQRDRRTQLYVVGAIAAGAVLLAVLGWLGVPGPDRLVATMDSDWFGLVRERGPHLFPTLWAQSAFPPIVAQTTTLVVASRCMPKDRGRLLLAAAMVGIGALAASALLSDTLHLTLFIQTQAWRATWLVAALGGAGLAICVPALWRRDVSGRLVLAALGLLWFFPLYPILTCAIAVAALTIDRRRPHAGPLVVGGAYAVAALLILQANAGPLLGYFEALRAEPASLAWSTIAPLRNNLHTLPLLLLTAAWLLSAPWPDRVARMGLALAALAIVPAAAFAWNQDPASHVAIETLQAPPGFSALRATSREVLWLDSRGEPWFALQRPQYLSPQQAVGIVFSRPLAMEWRRRAEKLVALGLAQKIIFTPFRVPADEDRARVAPQGVETLCHEPDAPETIFAPIDGDDPPPAVTGTIVWHLPQPIERFDRYATQGVWRTIRAFAIIPCRPDA